MGAVTVTAGDSPVRLLPDGGLDHDTLPDTAQARLPAAYEAIKTALVECERVDECRDWADKAAAHAAYARMRDDPALLRMAKRIQDWAVKRIGELLQEATPATNRYDVSSGVGTDTARRGGMQTARDAGLSKGQAVTAIRVARIPDAEFSQQVESDDPPTVSALAAQGSRKMGSKEAALRAMREAQSEPKPEAEAEVHLGARTPAEYQAASQLVGMVDEFVREAKTLNLDIAVRGLIDSERRYLADLVDRAAEWLSVVATRAGLNV
jgi:hypothetical protein